VRIFPGNSLRLCARDWTFVDDIFQVSLRRNPCPDGEECSQESEGEFMVLENIL
jgi:hypothetical protein